MDFSEANLLDGLEGEDRAARERLLERLAREGYSLEDLKAAIEEDRLALLLVERVLGGRYTVRDAAPDRFEWSFARKHTLKGMSEPVSLYRARRLAAGDEEATKSKEDRRRTRAGS